MYELVNPILQWINAHPQMAGLVTFIISAAESVAIIGTIVPGSVMMTALGALAGAGVMPLWSTLLWAIAGAIVGDSISYWIGYYFKDNLPHVWPFRRYPNLLENGEKFFKKHGGKSVFIGRFVGPVRALVPLIAGMLRMKPWRFTVANITSAIGWAPAYMLPGIALGAASLELPPDIAAHAILMIILITLFTILCLWVITNLFSLIKNQINFLLTKTWHRLQMSRYFSLITTALKHHDPKKTYGQLTLLFYFILISITFLYLTSYLILHKPQTIFLNNACLLLFRSLRTPIGTQIMLFFTMVGEPVVLFSLTIAFFLWFASTKRWRIAWHAFALGLLTAASIETFKLLVHEQRPWGILFAPHTLSFPSGHAAFSTAVYTAIALLLVRSQNDKLKHFFYIIAGILITAICISRLYLGAHWLTDVIAGVLLGSAVLMLVVLSFNRYIEKPIKTTEIFTLFLLALTISFSVYSFHCFQEKKRDVQLVEWPTYTVHLNNWWEQQGEHLPLYRINRFGLATQIFSLQWVENLDTIKTILLKNGWEEAQDPDWITFLHRISNIESTQHLPLVSPLYLDKKPVLVVVKKNSGGKLMVLRLWYPFLIFNDSKMPLWVGTIEYVPSSYSWIFKPRHINDIQFSKEQIFSTALNNYTIKRITVLNNHRRHNIEQTMILIKPK